MNFIEYIKNKLSFDQLFDLTNAAYYLNRMNSYLQLPIDIILCDPEQTFLKTNEEIIKELKDIEWIKINEISNCIQLDFNEAKRALII